MRFSRLFSDGIGRCIGRCYKACSGQNCHEQKAGDRLHRLAMACPSSCVQDGALDGPLAGQDWMVFALAWRQLNAWP